MNLATKLARFAAIILKVFSVIGIVAAGFATIAFFIAGFIDVSSFILSLGAFSYVFIMAFQIVLSDMVIDYIDAME